MGKVRDKWSQKQTDEKVLSVIGSICSISIIILACMQILGFWRTVTNVFEPLLGVLMLIQTIQDWKKNKVVAKLSLYAALLLLGFSFMKFVVR